MKRFLNTFMPVLAFLFIFIPEVYPVRLAGIFTDHMVLQRNKNVRVWGWGDSREIIRFRFNDQQQSVRCNAVGNWKVTLDPMEAGGPFQMEVIGKEDTIILNDILIGDVWICSGQSNMWRPVSDAVNAEHEIQSADYPMIRVFSYPRTLSIKPLDDIPPPHPDEARQTSLQWEICTPVSIRDFTAVGYFFGRDLFNHLKVPIGLIKDCWGSTKVEPWTSFEALSTFYPNLSSQLIDPVRALDSVTSAFTSRIDTASDEGLHGEGPAWYATDLNNNNWHEMYIPSNWEKGGLKGLDGIVWFRKDFFIPEQIPSGKVTLSLNRITDNNQVWINGHYVGKTRGQIPGSPFYGSQPESIYTVRKEFLHPGRNQLTVRIINYAGNGGIMGDTASIFIQSGSFTSLLCGTWKYRVGFTCTDKPPSRIRPHQYPTVLFNGMINPLVNLSLKGVIWYQGESNTGSPLAYRELFPLMIRDWRTRFGQGDFPFLFVQLAGYGNPPEKPGDDNWAMLREAQTMTLKEPNTGMAVTIDIGEADNIHPHNKQDVGKRLALAARKVAYGEELVYQGPEYRSMEIQGTKVRIFFDHIGSGLMLRDRYGYARGFAIAGEDHKWYWAQGSLEGDTIVISSRYVKHPVAVRYAWSQNPGDANLFNREMLPAVPFRTDDW